MLCHNYLMSKDISVKQKAAKTLAALKNRYPQLEIPLNFSNPWQLLVATQLSAQCTDARVNLITPEFFRLWPNPENLLSASQEEVEEVIRSTGFFRNKAKNLLGCARALVEDYGGQVPKDMATLLKLPGVARKTANVVLYGAYDINAGIAVDTHVKCVSWRLGLTVSQAPVQIEKDLMTIFPQAEWGALNLRMVWFGRDVCPARKPACSTCELAAFCPKNPLPGHKTPSGGKNEHESGAQPE